MMLMPTNFSTNSTYGLMRPEEGRAMVRGNAARAIRIRPQRLRKCLIIGM
jgi:hypothetical protein